MKEEFVPHKFSTSSLEVIERANVILEEYRSHNLVLTLRQLFYQFVSRAMLPNKQTEYKRLGSIISDARLAGLVDWAMMEDRTRFVREEASWSDPADIIGAIAQQYKEDLWASQNYRCEVWIEKDALVGVIESACNDLRVPYFACRGYASQSSQYEAGKRFRKHRRNGQKVVVFHFGDHDPSGIDMTRDNDTRVEMFTEGNVRFDRLALNMPQVDEFNPPPNPAKETDSRFDDYARRFGNTSWELDALEPTVIDRLIRDNVNGLINQRVWAAAVDQENENKQLIEAASDRWTELEDMLRDGLN